MKFDHLIRDINGLVLKLVVLLNVPYANTMQYLHQLQANAQALDFSQRGVIQALQQFQFLCFTHWVWVICQSLTSIDSLVKKGNQSLVGHSDCTLTSQFQKNQQKIQFQLDFHWTLRTSDQASFLNIVTPNTTGTGIQWLAYITKSLVLVCPFFDR